MILKKQHSRNGSTLPELMIAALLLATFFAGVFELNAVCLRFIQASKENVAAVETVQDRLEDFRAFNFSDVVSQSYMMAKLTLPPNASPFALQLTETVRIRPYPQPASNCPSITYTRAPGASVPPTPVAVNGALDTTGVIQVDVTHSWTHILGGRQRAEQASTLLAQGNKK